MKHQSRKTCPSLFVIAAGIAGAVLFAPFGSANANTCIVDSNNNGASDGADSDALADGSGFSSRLACGASAQAKDVATTAIGQGSDADGPGATSLGKEADASNAGAVAVGTFAASTGFGAVALGSVAIARGNNSLALGFGANTAVASGIQTHGNIAIGGSSGGDSIVSNPGADTLDSVNAANPTIANGGFSIAIGAATHTTGAKASALGAFAQATAEQALALGAYSRAGGVGSIAMGGDGVDGNTLGAQALAQRAVAIGFETFVNAANATAIGGVSSASGGNATAVGYQSGAAGASATAVGSVASAGGFLATAVGREATASGDTTTAVGYLATASASGATAVGREATAAHANATAIGKGAATTATNQVTIGGSGSSVRIGDMAASTAAQVGPVQAVTVDGSGTLGTSPVASSAQLGAVQRSLAQAMAASDAQFDQLSGRVGALEERFDLRSKGLSGGIAAAMAMGSAIVVPDKALSVSFNVATYGGEQGIAGSVTGRVSESVYLSAGFAGNTGDNRFGGQVGVGFGF